MSANQRTNGYREPLTTTSLVANTTYLYRVRTVKEDHRERLVCNRESARLGQR